MGQDMEKRKQLPPQGAADLKALREDVCTETGCPWLEEVPEREDNYICITDRIVGEEP